MVVKTVHKKNYNEPGLVQARLEGPTVLKCSSPQIVKCIEWFETTEFIFVVTEYCPGGDLQMYLESRKLNYLPEHTVK